MNAFWTTSSHPFRLLDKTGEKAQESRKAYEISHKASLKSHLCSCSTLPVIWQSSFPLLQWADKIP